MIVKPGYEGLSGQNQRLAFTQSILDQARIACAIERYRIRTGSLPATLEELEGPDEGILPRDVLTGQPYSYRPTAEGRFKLEGTAWSTPPRQDSLESKSELKKGTMEWGAWAWSR